MNPDHWTKVASEVVAEVGHETDPVYVVDADALAAYDGRLLRSYAAGWTVSKELMTEVVRPYLEHVDQWVGPGVAVAVSPSCFGNVTEFVGVALHEYAHTVDRNGLDADTASPELLVLLAHLYRQVYDPDNANKARDVLQLEANPKPWEGHGWQFVRICCHLAHRVQNVMESVRPKHLIYGEKYYAGMNENSWLNLLRDEVNECTSSPIADVIKTDPPKQFKQIWNQLTKD